MWKTEFGQFSYRVGLTFQLLVFVGEGDTLSTFVTLKTDLFVGVCLRVNWNNYFRFFIKISDWEDLQNVWVLEALLRNLHIDGRVELSANEKLGTAAAISLRGECNLSSCFLSPDYSSSHMWSDFSCWWWARQCVQHTGVAWKTALLL